MTDFNKVVDSGKREEMETGSVRDTRVGKGRYDLLPTRAIRRLAKHFENGAAKYGDRNWEKGQKTSRYLDSAMRHIFDVLEGKTNEDHAAAAMWNLACLIETQERIEEGILPAELDDLQAYFESDMYPVQREAQHNKLVFQQMCQDPMDDLIEQAVNADTLLTQITPDAVMNLEPVGDTPKIGED